MKRVMKIMGIGFVCGIILLVIQKVSSISEDTFLKGYYTVGIFVIVSAVLFNVFYNLSYNKKVQKAITLLKDGRPKEYIEQMEIIKQKAKGNTLRRVLDINLSAGYYDLKQYDKAIELLEPLYQVKLRGVMQIAWLLNLCLSYFHVQQNEKAMELYYQSKNKFDKFKSRGKYTENIMLLEIFVALEKREFSLANELVEVLEKQTTDKEIKEELSDIRENLKAVQYNKR